jgi:hypothetical protein
MKRSLSAVLFASIALAGCATQPLPPAAPVAAYADMRFATMPAAGTFEVTIPEAGPTFAFPEGPSSFAGVTLPARSHGTYLRFVSYIDGGYFGRFKLLVPRFVFLDDAKAPIDTISPQLLSRGLEFFKGAFYTGQVRVPERATFVVLAPAQSLRDPIVVTDSDDKPFTVPLLTAGETRLELSTVPTALVSDSVLAVSQARAQMFVIKELDGKPIPNSFGDSATRSHGQGMKLTPVTTRREVPAKKLKVKLRGSGTAGAPILSIIDSIVGDDPEVEGVVDFEPAEGRQYIVKGQLQEHGSSIWIEDAETGQPVTEKIVGP